MSRIGGNPGGCPGSGGNPGGEPRVRRKSWKVRRSLADPLLPKVKNGSKKIIKRKLQQCFTPSKELLVNLAGPTHRRNAVDLHQVVIQMVVL
jgi:hypothetical protein